MKRIGLHLLFWFAYLLQDSLLEFLWLGPALPNVPENNQLWMAFEAALVILLPKLLFTYYVMYIGIDRILKEKSRHFFKATEIVLLLLATIILYRVVFNYYVYPHIYIGILKIKPLFDGRLVLLSLMDIGFVSGAAITLKLLRKQLAGKEKEKSLVKEKLETELKFLRNQTNPHFLMNTLNNIYALARKKSDDTAEVVMKLSELLRYMLYESGEKFVFLENEIKMLEDYLELEKIRYDNRLIINFTKKVDKGSYQITPLLLLPFVENAFKHGVSETRFESFIRIDISVQDGNLNFIVENTKDMANGTNGKNNIGLANVRRQLELVYKDYHLDVIDKDNKFRIQLQVNLNNYVEI